MNTKKEYPVSIPYEYFLHKDLQDLKYAAGYLEVCLDDEDPAIFLIALRHVIDAHGGMTGIAKASGLNRESLYKALSLKGNPALQTIRKVTVALGLKIGFDKI